MTNSVVWKNADGRKRLNNWYEQFASKIECPIESISLPTKYGTSHVLVGGPQDAQPLVCLHAMRTGAAFLLSEMSPILKRYRVYAPDLPGQSIRGPEAEFSLKDDSLAQWLLEVLDGLELDRVNLFGVSWGGFLARLTATHSPDRIRRLAMLVPAGIVNGSHLTGLMKMAFPMIRYRLVPTEQNLRKLLTPILTTWDEDWANFIACSIRDMKIDMRIPPLATDMQLQQLVMPTMVMAAEQDISFPGHDMAKRLSTVMPSINVEVIPECKHCPPTTPEFREWLGEQLAEFVGE